MIFQQKEYNRNLFSIYCSSPDCWSTTTSTIPYQHHENHPAQISHHQLVQIPSLSHHQQHDSHHSSMISNNNNNNTKPKVQVMPIHSVSHYQPNTNREGGLSSSDTEDKDKFKCLYLLVETAVAVRQREKEQSDSQL